MRKRKKIFKRILHRAFIGMLGLAFSLTFQSAYAVTFNWNNAGTGVWTNAANWTPASGPSGVPTSADRADIRTGGTAILDGNAVGNAAAFYLYDGSTLAISDSAKLTTAATYILNSTMNLSGSAQYAATSFGFSSGAVDISDSASLSTTGITYFGSGAGNTGVITLSGSATIHSAASVSPSYFCIGYSTQAGQPITDATGTMILNDNTAVTIAGQLTIGYRTTGNNSLTMNGNSVMKVGNALRLAEGDGTYGELTINDNAQFLRSGSTAAASIAYGENSTAVVTINGGVFEATYNNGNFGIGFGKNSHATFIFNDGILTSSAPFIANGVDSVGIVEINGGSWTSVGTTNIGSVGTGTLTVTGGDLRMDYVTVGGNGSDFTLNNATLLTGSIRTSKGGTFSIDGATIRARINETATFINGFTEVPIGASGVIFDTNGFNIGIASPLADDGAPSGDVTKNGTGILYFNAANTYTGTTNVNAGTLVLRELGTIAESEGLHLAAGATFSISSITATQTSVKKIIGGGNVSLGNKTLEIFEGNLSGVISDNTKGNILKSGTGELVLGGVNTYRGTTTVDDGTLTLNAANSIATSSYVYLNDSAVINGNADQTFQGLLSRIYTTVDMHGNAITIGAGSVFGAINNASSLTKNTNGTLNFYSQLAYTGPTNINGGTLALIINDAIKNSSVINLNTGTLSAASDQTFKDIRTAAGTTLNMGGNNLSAYAGTVNGSATGVKNLTKTTAGTLTFNTPLSITGNLMVSEGTFNVHGLTNPVTVAGAATFASGTTFGLGNHLQADSVTISSNVTFDLQSYTGPNPVTVITSAQDIVGNFSIIKIGGVEYYPNGPSMPDLWHFINNIIVQKTDPKHMVASMGTLVWNNTLPGTAHGAFYIEDGSSFTLDANLADNTLAEAWYTNGQGYLWDGKTLMKTGGGTLVLTGNNTYTGQTQVTDGRLAITGASAVGGSSDIAVSTGAAFELQFTTDDTFGKVISGGGDLIKSGTGTATISVVNTYTGDTYVNGGVLHLAVADAIATSGNVTLSNGNLSSATDQTLHNLFTASGTDVDMRGNGLTIDGGSLSGTLTAASALTKNSVNDLNLNHPDMLANIATVNFNGGTTTSLGTQTFQTLNTGAGAMLDMNGYDLTVEAGTLSGTHDNLGVFTKTTAGTVNLGSVDALASASLVDVIEGDILSTLDQQVQSLRLAVDTRFDAGAGDLNVVGGFLTGFGTAAGQNVTIGDGTVVAPGNDTEIATLYVEGDLAFDAGSRYNIKLNPQGEQSDLIVVTGSADLGGATVQHIGYDGEYEQMSEWTILTATDGLGGTRFDPYVVTNYAFLTGALIYGAEADYEWVKLKLMRNDVDLEDYAGTPNQKETARGLNCLRKSKNPLYGKILGLTTQSNIPDIYDQLSGEIHASLLGMLQEYDRSFARLLRQRMWQRERWDDGYPLWFAAEGSNLNARGDYNAARSQISGYNATLGAEKYADGWMMGTAFRYADNDQKVVRRHSFADIHSYVLGVYGARQFNNWQILMGGTYGLHEANTTRNVVEPSLAQRLTSRYRAHSAMVFTEVVNYWYATETTRIMPGLGFAWNTVHSENFTEAGGDGALRSRSNNFDNLATTLGLHLRQQFGMGFALEGDFYWQHIFGPIDPDATLNFQGGCPFTILGSAVSRDAFGMNVTLVAQLTERLSVRPSYFGFYGTHSVAHYGNLLLEYQF